LASALAFGLGGNQSLSTRLGCLSTILGPCSVVPDWSPGLIPSRITSLIYIDFDELE
jgi:hypothetical protein